MPAIPVMEGSQWSMAITLLMGSGLRRRVPIAQSSRVVSVLLKLFDVVWITALYLGT